MRWDVVKFWAVLTVVLVALLVVGTVSRRGKRRSGQDSLQDRHRQQIEALAVLVEARRKCAGVQASISKSWRSAIDQGSDSGWGFKQALESDPQGEVAAARAAQAAAEAKMGDPGMREGDLGPALLDYYAAIRQICGLALVPVGHSLATYDEDSASLAIAATAQEVRLGGLLSGGTRRSPPSAAIASAVAAPKDAEAPPPPPPPAVSLPELPALVALKWTVGRRREGSPPWAKRAVAQAEALGRSIRLIQREGLSASNCAFLSTCSQPGIDGPIPSGKTRLDDLYARALVSFAEAGRECSAGREDEMRSSLAEADRRLRLVNEELTGERPPGPSGASPDR